MAENKKSVLLYCDIIHTVKKLNNNQAGKLFKHYLEYINDENPQSDQFTELIFEPIKQNLKRDLKKWDEIINKRSAAGKASAEKRKQKSTDSTHVESVEQTSTNSTVKDKEVKRESDFNFDFIDPVFSEGFFRFLDYRKKIHKEFKTQMSLEACYKNLIELSKNNSEVANKIIDQSIRSEWESLYELKTNSKQITEQPTKLGFTLKSNTKNG